MEKLEIHAFELTLSFVVTQLHLIIFGPAQSDESDQARDARYEKRSIFFDSYLAGLDVQFKREPRRGESPWGHELVVRPIGWPEGSWIKTTLMPNGNVLMSVVKGELPHPESPLLGSPLEMTIHIPGLFSGLTTEWNLLPPHFFQISSQNQVESDLFRKLRDGVFNPIRATAG
ncbi:MAG: hypothetical protein Q8P88_00590 [Candidatus Jorgensenbacteria bacterium]|nr:hypothetical protein [Candidatus Jorgensenbacteria bacterium]